MPRKTRRGGVLLPAQDDASMRPRPDATENVVRHLAEIIALVASMRPRPDATENMERTLKPAPDTSRFNEAAARCHGKRAQPPRRPAGSRSASMRPRPDATENAWRAAILAGRPWLQ